MWGNLLFSRQDCSYKNSLNYFLYMTNLTYLICYNIAMDKQAYHYNKKKPKGKTAGTYRYFYPCDPYDNPDIWLEDKAYAEIEVTEREWQILYSLDKEEYNDNHAYIRKFTPLIYSKDEEELSPKQRQKRIGKKQLFDELLNDKIDINRAMSRLNEQEREVYYLFHFKDLKQADIAKQLGKTQGYISMVLEKAEEKVAEYDGDKTPDGVAWRYWKVFVRKGHMPNYVDVEIEYALSQLVCDIVPFFHWFYSASDLIRFATKSYLYANDKMEKEIKDYLACSSSDERQHFEDYYGDQPVIIGALYIRFVKEINKRKKRGLHERDNIYTTFINMADKIAKRVHMTTGDFIEKRFLPYVAEKRMKSVRQFYKLYTGKSLPKK